MDIRGCYETGVRANEVSTATGYVNPLKAVRYALYDGWDETLGKQMGVHTGEVTTFEDFYAAFFTQYAHLIDLTLQCADAYEHYMGYINPSSLYSATITTSLEKGLDGYQNGVKFNNSAVLCCGLGSAVDAIMAVKQLSESISMDELRAVLEANWEGYEKLRLRVRRSPHKYGNNDPATDRIACAVAAYFTDRVSGRKNARGGIYKPVLHSAMQFVWQGQKTGATPDGRRKGEEISKNGSPAPGMDREGVTALVKSALKLVPSSWCESFCVDVMMHPTAVQGQEGIAAMRGVLDTYDQGGGQSLQFNVFDTATLRKAQETPEAYRNLQVRVCGWNVLWNNLSRNEQDAYILRAENIC
jgi:formate C-acetyltransferase